MKKGQNQTKIGGLLALLLFGVFAVCVLAVLLTGADAYKGLTERDRGTYDGRTAAQYLTTRVRQADTMDGLRIEPFDSVDALVLAEEIGGALYETRIYCYDGYVRELFSAAGNVLAPEDGDKVLPAEALALTWQEECLQMEITGTDGAVQRLLMALRSGKEVSP